VPARVVADLEALPLSAIVLSPKEPMERSSSQQPPAVTAPAPEKAAVWEDFLDIFYAPSSVFARRENGNFWIPMLVVTAILTVLAFVNSRVMDPIMQAETHRAMAAAMAKDPRITPEVMQQMSGVTNIITKVATVIGIPFVIFLMGVTLYFVGKLFGAKQTFHAALVVAAYAYVPRIIEGVLAGLQGFFVDPTQLDGRYRLTLGVGRFLDPDTVSPVLIGLVGRVDVFTIWVTVLLAIGLSVTGRIPRAKAAMAAAVIWLIGALPGVFSGVRSSV
jgi:Yip1-like protein